RIGSGRCCGRTGASSRPTRIRAWSTRRRTTCRRAWNRSSAGARSPRGIAAAAGSRGGGRRDTRAAGGVRVRETPSGMPPMLSDFENARFLLVDDEEPNLRLLERILERAGYTQYKSTTDPRDALPIFLEFEPDLVLLDLHMPHIDGFAV